MARLHTRKRDLARTKTPSFLFTVRAVVGLPVRDGDAVRAEKDRIVAEHIARRGVTKLRTGRAE